jgi:hypothetical protein
VRHTGRYYRFILGSLALHIFGSILLSSWNEHTSTLKYYLDVVPMGAAYASFLSCSIIVCLLVGLDSDGQTQPFLFQGMIANVHKEEIAVATGSAYSLISVRKLFRNITRSHLLVQNNRSGYWG